MADRIAVDDPALPRWTTAYHEAGHAVIHTESGLRLHRAVLTSDEAGYTRLRKEKALPTDSMLQRWLIGIVAGHEAETVFLHRNVGIPLKRARRESAGSAQTDRRLFRRYARGTTHTLDDIRAEAHNQILEHWPDITRTARRLHANGRITHI